MMVGPRKGRMLADGNLVFIFLFFHRLCHKDTFLAQAVKKEKINNKKRKK